MQRLQPTLLGGMMNIVFFPSFVVTVVTSSINTVCYVASALLNLYNIIARLIRNKYWIGLQCTSFKFFQTYWIRSVGHSFVLCCNLVFFFFFFVFIIFFIYLFWTIKTKKYSLSRLKVLKTILDLPKYIEFYLIVMK